MGTCDHCGLIMLGYATVTQHDGTVAKLCHTSAIGRPDCYRRVTVYHEPLGFLKNMPLLPEGIKDIADPGRVLARELAEMAEMFPDQGSLVCVTHKRFIPCRREDGTCAFSGEPGDVKAVREYQAGND